MLVLLIRGHYIFLKINNTFRRQQEIESSGGHGPENPALMHELRALRMRKDELESHLTTLQDSRRQLMIQLEGLMKMLKNHQSSPRSTPNSSPRSTKSPPLPPGASQPPPPPAQSGPRSAPQTPMGGAPPPNQLMSTSMIAGQVGDRGHVVQGIPRSGREEVPVHNNGDSLVGVGGDVRNAFGGSASINMG